jgi:hypothetical protein
MRAVAVGVLVACSCGSVAEPEPAKPVASGVTIDWDMRVEAGALRIDYAFHNNTQDRVTVTDRLVAGGRVSDDVMIVRADDDPTAVAFTRAFVFVDPRVKPYFTPSPYYRDVEAGGEIRGHAHVRLPLAPWLNYGAAVAIAGTRPTGVLELGYFDDPSVDAKSAPKRPMVGQHGYKLARSPTRPLPPGVALESIEDQIAHSFGNVIPLPPTD